MGKLFDRFERLVMSISYQQRKERELARYKVELANLESMDIVELDLEYVNLKTTYEHKKTVLSIFMVSVIIAVLMNVWKSLFEFIEKSIQYSALLQDGGEAGKVAFVYSALIGFCVTVVICIVLVTYMRGMRQTYRKLIVVEGMKDKRNNLGEDES